MGLSRSVTSIFRIVSLDYAQNRPVSSRPIHLLHSLFDFIEKPLAMHDGQNQDAVRLHLVDQAITVDESLPDTVIARLWDDGSDFGEFCERLGRRKEFGRHSASVEPRIAGNIGDNLF